MYGRTQSRSTGLFMALCAGMLVLAVLSQQPWAAGARGAAKSLLAPLEATMTDLADRADRATAVFGDVATLRSENARLRASDATLQEQVVELQAAAEENASLRQALDFERSFGHRMVSAQVVGHGPDGFSRTLEIDRGTADGIEPGMIVTTGAGLVGRVTEAGPRGAIVQTLADPQSRVSVFLSKSALEGTVMGGPTALEVQIEHSAGATASTGEWALTSGVGGGYPRGLLVGRLTGVTHRDSATTDEAALAWVNEPESLTLVLVITDFAPS
jgi:rod shape-determining protein MreC